MTHVTSLTLDRDGGRSNKVCLYFVAVIPTLLTFCHEPLEDSKQASRAQAEQIGKEVNTAYLILQLAT